MSFAFVLLLLLGFDFSSSSSSPAQVAATATQLVLKYEAESNANCTIKVSTVNRFDAAYQPVNSINEALFPGSSSDAQSAAGPRFFVVGKRTATQGKDGKWYSLALQADTVHYYQVSGCMKRPLTGSLRTTNPPNGNTYVEPSLWDNTGGQYLTPSWPDSPGIKLPEIARASAPQADPPVRPAVIDPQTGALIRRVTLPVGGLQVRGAQEGWAHICSDFKTDHGTADPHGGFRCAIEAEDGAGLYWISTEGDVRYLGAMTYEGDASDNYEFAAGALSAANGYTADGNSAYPNYVYAIVRGLDDGQAAGRSILLRFNQDGDSEVPAGASWAAAKSAVNLTPGPNQTITDLMVAFDSKFFPPAFPFCSLRTVQGDHVVFICQNAAEGSVGWLGVLNLGDRKPRDATCEQARSNCPRLEALTPVFQRTSSRWCGIRSVNYVAGEDGKWVQMELATTDKGPSGGPYESILSLGVNPIDTKFALTGWHNGEPNSPDSGYVQDLAPGDLLQFAGNQEMVRVSGKSGQTLTVERGCRQSEDGSVRCGGTGSAPHHAGEHLAAICAEDPGTWWWDFDDAPQGEDSGAYYVRDEKMRACERVSREPYDICAGYLVRNQTPWTAETFNRPPDFRISRSLSFAGIASGGESYLSHESMNHADGSQQANSWLTDEAAFQGAAEQDRVAKVNGARYLYKYEFAPAHKFSAGKLPYFALSGTMRLRDISGPGARLEDTETDNNKFCIAGKTGECRPGSKAGEVFGNFRELTHLSCAGGGGSGDSGDWCVEHPAFQGHSVPQLGLQPANKFGESKDGVPFYGASKSRVLVSATMLGPYRSRALGFPAPTVLPDGSWILFRCLASPTALYADYCMVKVPPPPGDDGIDRIDHEDVSIAVAPYAGSSYARIKYGYEEYGPRDSFYCTQRPEICYSENQTPGATATLKIGIPQHVLFYQIEYLDDSGRIIETGATMPVVIP